MKLTSCLFSLLVVGASAAPATVPQEGANLQPRTILEIIRCKKGGGHWNVLTISCDCPSGQSWDWSSGRCQQNQPQCPQGQYWDAQSGRCRGQTPQCPDGQYWDAQSGRCRGQTPQCPDGQYWNSDNNCCEDQPQCPDGQYWNSDSNCCENSAGGY